jgi:hypothetical protein
MKTRSPASRSIAHVAPAVRPGSAWRVGVFLATAIAAVALATPRTSIPKGLGHPAFVDGRTLIHVPGELGALSCAELSVLGVAGPTLPPR